MCFDRTMIASERFALNSAIIEFAGCIVWLIDVKSTTPGVSSRNRTVERVIPEMICGYNVIGFPYPQTVQWESIWQHLGNGSHFIHKCS